MPASLLLTPDKKLVHEVDCMSWDTASSAEADPTGGITTDRDELMRYALSVRPCYDRLNRVIGQLAGLFILAHARGRVEPDFEPMAAVLAQLAEVREALHGVRAPVNAQRHLVRLRRVLHLIDEVAAQFHRGGWTRERTNEALGGWNNRLKTAHAHVRAASAAGLGMTPVDFGQACCSCHAAPTATVPMVQPLTT